MEFTVQKFATYQYVCQILTETKEQFNSPFIKKPISHTHYEFHFKINKFTHVSLPWQQDTNADQGADMFEHVKDSDSHHDAQTLDTATTEQQREQGQITQKQEDAESDVDEDLEMQKEESEDIVRGA